MNGVYKLNAKRLFRWFFVQPITLAKDTGWGGESFDWNVIGINSRLGESTENSERQGGWLWHRLEPTKSCKFEQEKLLFFFFIINIHRILRSLNTFYFNTTISFLLLNTYKATTSNRAVEWVCRNKYSNYL